VKRCFPESGEKVATLGELARQDAFLDVPDPVGQSLQVYQQVADLIRQLLEDARKEIEKRIKI
jgi:protein-tyrosine-phosphatase